MCCRAVALVVSVWNWRPRQLQGHETWVGATSKIAALVLPALIIGLRKSYQVALDFAPAVVLLNILSMSRGNSSAVWLEAS